MLEISAAATGQIIASLLSSPELEDFDRRQLAKWWACLDAVNGWAYQPDARYPHNAKFWNCLWVIASWLADRRMRSLKFELE